MEAYRQARGPHTRTSHLTKLYSDAKKSALTSLEVQPTSTTDAQSASLQRKYRIQKDRLITWGLEWTDGEKGSDGDIDESAAKAGVTETVESVLRNIQEVTEEAERIKWASSPMTKPGEAYPQKLATFDNERYEDLLRDLTASIDTLYDLSISRRALARGEHPTFEDALTEAPPEEYPPEKPSSGKQKQILTRPSHNKTEFSPVSKQRLSPYAGIPAQIDTSALRLPNEGPPPYEAIGVPSTTRMIAKLDRRRTSAVVQDALGSPAPEVPVMVEYANFDMTYRDTGVPPPLQRLEQLATVFQPMRAESQTNISLLGYFEDATQPRIGLVYDLPYTIQNRLQVGTQSEPQTPLSLLKLVQKANKTQGQGAEAPPPALEHRFRMALRLTEQLHTLHSSKLAHGDINSSSVIFTTAANETENEKLEQLRKPLWASFDLFSKTNIEGVMQPPDFNIYRHPKDLPFQSDRDFPTDIKYDLYGLGLVLLEIGLWTPIGDLYKSKYSLADFKLRLEKIWIPKLSAKCGSAYMRAVETCLRLSDDPDSSRLTVEGIYGILLQFMKRCCLLDDIGTSTELIPASELISVPTSPAPSSVRPSYPPPQRQLSEASSFTREQSTSSLHPHLAQRFDSLPNLTRVASPPSIEESASQQLGRLFDRPLQPQERFRFTSSPSSRDFKRRIRLIQQKWRERRALKGEQLRRRSNEEVRELSSKPKREEFPEVKLPQDILEHWQNTLSFQLQALVERALRDSPESSSIRLLPYGESPETAKPTLIVGCTSTAKVKHILKRHFKYDPNVYDVRVKKEVIRRCRGSRRGRPSDATRSMAPKHNFLEDKAVNPGYQDRPLCGASIGAYRYDEHLPPASFGGVVLVDGRPYGMSVHHMLEPEEDSEGEDEAPDDADDKSDTSSLSDSDSNPLSEDEDQQTIRPPSTQDEPINTDDTTGDCPGIIPGDMEEVAITQPALDDAIDCDLHAEESDDEDSDSGIDEDHLLSFKLGQVHVSSGLKRTKKHSHQEGFKSIALSLPQEIDWALFELVPPRMYPFNVVRGGGKYCPTSMDRKGNSLPTAIKPSTEIACAKVHCLGRTSGLGHGTVSSTMELVKIRGRSTFSASWTVVGNFGIGGDSGAWVISNEDGKVCGHVLASKTGRTYICPMDLLLEDIRSTLGAREVSLPMVAGKGERSEERKLAERLKVQDEGGVAVPPSPMKARRTVVEPVG